MERVLGLYVQNLAIVYDGDMRAKSLSFQNSPFPGRVVSRARR